MRDSGGAIIRSKVRISPNVVTLESRSSPQTGTGSSGSSLEVEEQGRPERERSGFSIKSGTKALDGLLSSLELQPMRAMS